MGSTGQLGLDQSLSPRGHLHSTVGARGTGSKVNNRTILQPFRIVCNERVGPIIGLRGREAVGGRGM